MSRNEVEEKPTVEVAIVVLAKDEEKRIGNCLAGILGQSLITAGDAAVRLLVVANGCTDATASAAETFLRQQTMPGSTRFDVHDVVQPGKSRAWNLAVHDLLSDTTDFMFFVDSDIEFASDAVLAQMLANLIQDARMVAFVGLPLKHNERLTRRSWRERLSSLVSRNTRYTDAICGQLYVMRAHEAKRIWLPDETPGEDGFLNAMVNTEGFVREHQDGFVRQSRSGTHYFEDISFREFVSHERRMITGTVINSWIFEDLQAQQLAAHGGAMIRRANQERPDWVQAIINRHVDGKRWVLPLPVVLRRFGSASELGPLCFARRFPIAAAATLMSLPSMFKANAMLKREGVASRW